MLRSIVVVIGLALLVSACSGKTSQQVKTMQRKDKMLTCKEILLEMNEAEFYKTTAEKNKGPDIGSVLMPLGYISTYMNAQEAVDSAKARVDYLDRIYQIMECDGRTANPDLGGASYAPLPPQGGMGYIEAPAAGMGAYPYAPPPAAGQVHYRHEPDNERVGFYPDGMYW